MDGLGGLLGVCAFMFLGAYASGCLPYCNSASFGGASAAQFAAAAALGGGLLLGSALAVVIPEGFHAFANAAAAAGAEATLHGADAHAGHDHAGHDHGHGAHDGALPHGATGLALVAGFLAMMALDAAQAAGGGGHLGCGHGAHAHGNGEPAAAAGAAAADAKPAAAAASAPAAGGCSPADRALAGLLVHCAADGLAMGAAALSGDAALSLVVGVAMVLHKAPMALGLSTFLLAARWPWPRARRALLAFSAAAPAAALATFAALRAVPALTSPAAVSLALLFSGGTFLHAACMHVLPEVAGGGAGGTRLAAVAAGALLPTALSWGHSH